MKLPRLLPLLLLGSVPAYAVDLRDANIVIFGNITTDGGHVEGASLVGGDWSGASYEIRQVSASAAPGGAGLMLGGDNLTTIGLRIFNGDAIYGGAQGTMNVQNGAAISQAVDLTDYATQATNVLSYFSTFTTSSLDLSDPNNTTVDLTTIPEQNGYRVFEIDASQMTGNRTIDFTNEDADDTVVIRITGDNLDWNWSNNFLAERMLWLYEGTSININSREWRGSLVAPNAAVDQHQNFNGTLVADSLHVFSSVEMHNFPFIIPVPEPGSAGLTMLSVGFLALRRRRRSGSA
jgi:choice-of-anchor A domain-containing protein